VKPRPVLMAALTNNVLRRMRVGSSAGVRTVETVVADTGFGPPSDTAEAGRESTEELEDHRWLTAGFAECGCGLRWVGGLGESCRL
jgi:hypothetical protein